MAAYAILSLALISLSAGLSEPFSFESPLLPNHGDDWEVTGSAAPLRRFVRLTPPIANREGALLAKAQLPEGPFTIECKIAVSGGLSRNNQGAAIWLSYSAFKDFTPGNFYGLSPAFRGVVIYMNASSKSVGGLIADGKVELRQDQATPLRSCEFDSMNKEVRIEVRVRDKVMKVSLAEGDGVLRECFQIVVAPKPAYLGLSAATVRKEHVNFDVYYVKTEAAVFRTKPQEPASVELQKPEDEEKIKQVPLQETQSSNDLEDELTTLQNEFAIQLQLLKEDIARYNSILKTHEQDQDLCMQTEIETVKNLAQSLVDRVAKLKTHISNRQTNSGKELAIEFSTKTQKVLSAMESEENTLKTGVKVGEVHDLVAELLDGQLAKKSGNEVVDDVKSLMRLVQDIKDNFHQDYRLQLLQYSLGGAILFIFWVFLKVRATSNKATD